MNTDAEHDTAERSLPGPIFLIGPRGCGKTTVGRMVARALGLAFADTDQLAVEAAGRSIADVVERDGWEAFRRLEAQVLAEAARPGHVVATGGGAVLDESNRELMRASGLVVYLAAPVDSLYARLSESRKSDQRPSLTGADPLEEISRVVAEREHLYQACAHHSLDASQTASKVAGAVVRVLQRFRDEVC